MTTETTLDAVYEAWQDVQDIHTTFTRERFEEALIGEFYSYAELAEHVLDGSGLIEDIESQIDSNLANYFKFDYEGYGRDLDWGGDVYTVELQLPIGTAGHTIKRTYYFWSSI
jgi:antirestriction protein